MPQIVIRKIEARVVAQLKRRAKQNGRSLQEEVRNILRNGVREKKPVDGGLVGY